MQIIVQEIAIDNNMMVNSWNFTGRSLVTTSKFSMFLTWFLNRPIDSFIADGLYQHWNTIFAPNLPKCKKLIK